MIQNYRLHTLQCTLFLELVLGSAKLYRAHHRLCLLISSVHGACCPLDFFSTLPSPLPVCSRLRPTWVCSWSFLHLLILECLIYSHLWGGPSSAFPVLMTPQLTPSVKRRRLLLSIPSPCGHSHMPFVLFLLISVKSIVALQCCVQVSAVQQSESKVPIHISILF